MTQSPSTKFLNTKIVPTNYVLDKTRQKIITKRELADEKDLPFMDNRFVIPHSIGAMIMCSLHHGHPDREALMAIIAYISWARILREVVDKAQFCEQCLQSGKNSKFSLRQNK